MEFKVKDAQERYIPALGRTVKKGDTFVATGDLAQGFLGQTDLYERTDTPDKPQATDNKEQS